MRSRAVCIAASLLFTCHAYAQSSVTISGLLDARERLYLEADITVDAAGQTPGETAAAIRAALTQGQARGRRP